MTSGKNSVQPATSGSTKELLAAISAQYAILESAVNLINHRQKSLEQELEKDKEQPGWVYNMSGLEKWLHYYTERRKLHCPKCKEDREFVCTECLTQYKYHDDL